MTDVKEIKCNTCGNILLKTSGGGSIKMTEGVKMRCLFCEKNKMKPRLPQESLIVEKFYF